ncbi:MAG: DNA replication and repair protein RecF [Actinobacteria bacterium]|nr:DNA replication and repair protein RecF [Actinomycetota bacterium]
MIEEVYLKDFRNYEEAGFRFSKGLNAIIGDNGLGKTNLLEALFFLLQGKTMRGSEPKELVRWGTEKAQLGIKVSGGAAVEKRIEICEEGRKEKGKLGGIRAVFFKPDDIWMIKGGPESRRKYLDEAVVEIKRGFRVTLREYHRVLRQRNEAIRAVKRGSGDIGLVRSWNPLLARWGRMVVEERAEGLKELEKEMDATTGRWGVGKLEARLYSSMGDFFGEEDKLIRKIERMESAEIGRGMTLIGPHRDEVIFNLGGRSARRDCSQGEQKLIAMVWKMALAETIARNTREKVILLMDDCLSELDRRNRLLVLRELEKWEQVFVTHAEDLEELKGFNKIFLGRENRG